VKHQRDRERDDQVARGVLIANTLDRVLPPVLLAGNYDRIRDFHQAVWDQRDVSSVKIYDQQGELLIGPGPDQGAACVFDDNAKCIVDQSVMEKVAGLQPVSEWSEDTLVITAPIKSGAQVVGAVQFTLDSDRINAEIASLRQDRILEMLATVAVGAVVAFAIASYITVPLRLLVGVTNRLAGGDLGARVDELPGNEMKALGRSFNTMAGELEGKITELEDSRQRIVTAQESVRREIATHLHGSVQGSLLAMKVELDELAKTEGLDAGLASRIKTLSSGIAEFTQAEIAAVSRRLYPAIIRRGLIPSLQSLLDRYESSLTLEVVIDEHLKRLDEAGSIPEQTRLGAYRIAEEALGNIVKHAPSAHVRIEVELVDDCVNVVVRDDGPGFEPTGEHGGLGLATMQDYAGAVGGSYSLSSKPGAGTEVRAKLPIGLAELDQRINPFVTPR
jgi:signal transduction histidine kinase